jgi:hypothetical protein
MPKWEAVRDTGRGRRILYRRLVREDGSSIGAVSRKPEGVRALMYGPDRKRPHQERRELGHFATEREAMRRVEDETQ